MSVRVRTKTKPFPAGGKKTYTIFGATQPTETQVPVLDMIRATCTDRQNEPGDKPLSIESFHHKAVPLSGFAPNPLALTRVELDKWYHSSQFQPGSHIVLPSLPLFDAAAFLASVNPNKGQIGLPEFIREFKEMPRLLQLAGNTILKKGAGAYLTYQFGWKPLISDAKKMMDFTGRVDRKVRELHELYNRGGIHRMRVTNRDTGIDTTNYTAGGISVSSITLKTSRVTTRRRWATTRFVPTTLPPRDESDYRRRAMQIVLGMDLSPSTAWQLMPWSWLIDWFSNVGDYLVQFNNTCPVKATPPCVMTHTQTIEIHTRTDNITSCKGGELTLERNTKLRAIAAPTLSASVPFLTNRQLSILGALSIVKHRAR